MLILLNVSWNDATTYTKWLSNQTGKQYSLPTEAEWEYAARAGTETKYWWGNEIDKSKANYNHNLALYDTSGNVWEWTCSEYIDKYNYNEKQCVKSSSRSWDTPMNRTSNVGFRVSMFVTL
ncbi:formylglycine-generating enzyme family protein [Candidatus Marithrix sp. Canyon 246]|uniref:formylglycine-generating enzyme family protein n=1 Tax=Candidatus Marithrix sp. Canyon 246 TaxID=1827136 RepID=UPI001C0C5EC1|nr:SUMF1/EgtB/PvdO family nonheme iron enzyme [Candidatus Marithrix sp. Canyon 246]